MMRRPADPGQRTRPALLAIAVATALLSALAAAALLLDERGLTLDLFPHGLEPEGKPLVSIVQERPRLDPSLAGEILYSSRVFAARWRGWLAVEGTGEFSFQLRAGEPAYLELDSERVEAGEWLRRSLEPGLHPLEVVYRHRAGGIALEALWQPPGGELEPLDPGTLFPERPGLLRRAARRLSAGRSPLEAKLAGWALLVLAALIAWAAGAAGRAGSGGRSSVWRRAHERLAAHPWPRPVFFAVILVLASAAVYPWTGSPLGLDDGRSLEAAVRLGPGSEAPEGHAHLYLLRLFITVAAGDPFAGARLLWSVLFGVTVSALAAGAASLGARLQLGSFALSLFLLFCQPLYFSRAGAATPEATSAALIAVAVALFLHRLWASREPSVEWQALAIGGLTVWAVASRELSLVLLFLPLLFLLDRRRVSLRGFGSKLLAWATGAACGLVGLMVLDFLYLRDFWLSLRPSSFQAPFPPAGAQVAALTALDPGLLSLGLLVLIAAALATGLGKRLELRLVHLLPLLYLVLVVLTRVPERERLPAADLLPVLPVACLLAAAGFSYLGLDDLRWRDLSSPRFFVPALALGVLVAAIALPYREGRIAASDLPLAGLQQALGWSTPEALLERFLTPLVLVLLLGLLAFAHHHLSARVLLLTALLLLVLGPSFRETLRGLDIRSAAQRSEAHLYPVRVLGEELREIAPAVVVVTPALLQERRLLGGESLAGPLLRIHAGGDVEVRAQARITSEIDVALGTAEDLDRWLGFYPELESTAVTAPSGEVVLVRPGRVLAPAAEETGWEE